ncbi:response regulator transcription factor [Streptococcus catagoni]|uniref:response regulator transcription factor n=1 Tax=Streptococcus catagoni TaxID=2654874 RepID=UPI00140B3303|nr:response regulator transcription factor [Streptococcus catagoni]
MYKVLLVDDEYMILQGLKVIIDWKSFGFEVAATAKSAKEALDYLSKDSFHVLISDVNMPQMSGLDLIEEAKKRQPQLQTMILSGYQEFDYVKKAIELETKAYLLKPVDKKELEEKMASFKAYLDQQKKEEDKKDKYQEILINYWLHDELSEKDYLELINKKYPNQDLDYTVLYLHYRAYEQGLNNFFLKQNQLLNVIHNEEKQELFAILVGKRQEAKSFVKNLQKSFTSIIDQLVLGETVEDWENVYESYNQVQKSLFFNQEISSRDSQSYSKIDIADSELQFLSFNKALMIGDRPTIIRKLEAIFEEMRLMDYTPEDVKHVSFLLFLDIYRKFPSLDKRIYNAMLETIHESSQINMLKDALLRVLEVTKEDKAKQKRYSALVSEAIAFITNSYAEDLSLKYIADQLHVNGVYLGQCFKNETKQSFAQYLNQIRIQKAQTLLLYTNDSINEIAYQTGYNTNHYFIKIFKKLNGLSPKEFRDQYKNNYQSIEKTY